jgi:hypothetical protein
MVGFNSALHYLSVSGGWHLRPKGPQKIVEKAIEDIEDQDGPEPPVDLGERVAEYLQQHPESRWDAAVAAIADDDDPDEGIDE